MRTAASYPTAWGIVAFMIDHIGIQVTNLDASVAFYTRALAPLGFKLIARIGQTAGFGAGKADFWIGAGAPTDKLHIAFAAKGRAEVRAFYDAAIAAGGVDNGGPGVRAEYHPDYYGAFVRDPDGHNVEAVWHQPRSS
jgi:catechol 2,3-dioxygenase-like lactoylglutathione lyase family enzyme